jgi:hypothetical protein
MLRKLLVEPITLEPVGEKGKKNRGYKFWGTLTIERLIEGEAGSRTAVVTPAGFEPAFSVRHALS